MVTVVKNESSQAKNKKDFTYQRDKERENVKGIFKFYEVPGGLLSFIYKAYEGDEVERYDLVDGQVYTIPLGVARHLNKNGAYPEYEYNKSEGGIMTPVGNGREDQWIRVSKKVRRFGFNSLEFLPDEESQSSQSNIVTVERV